LWFLFSKESFLKAVVIEKEIVQNLRENSGFEDYLRYLIKKRLSRV